MHTKGSFDTRALVYRSSGVEVRWPMYTPLVALRSKFVSSNLFLFVL